MSSKDQSQKYQQKHINDFTKAIAGEVRILLSEVGSLREQKRQLEYELAEVLSMKAKFGAGGEYMPDWRPQVPPPLLEAPPPPEAPAEVPQARPGWRTVDKPRERKPRQKKTPGVPAGAGPAMIAPPPGAPHMELPPPPNLPAWAQWRPNPLLAPTPVVAHAAMPTSPPPRSGLFGPATPPPK